MVELNATLVAQIINFLLLVLILAKFAYKPLMQTLEARKKQIADSIATAEKERAAAEQYRLEYQQQLAQARTQAQAIVEKATKLAEQTKDQILEEARTENARLLKAAQEEIKREHERALAELRRDVVALSITAAAKIIEQNLNTDANTQLVNEFINKLDDSKVGGLHAN